MNQEIKRLTLRVKNAISQGQDSMIVVLDSFPTQNRPVPLKKPMAALSVSHAAISDLSIGNFTSPNLSHKQLDINWKLTIVSPLNAGNCWELFEAAASKLAFSSEIHASKIECTEPKFSKELGGIVIVANISASFTMVKDNPESDQRFTNVIVSAELSN